MGREIFRSHWSNQTAITDGKWLSADGVGMVVKKILLAVE
jgi:hypothetical protein